MTEGTMQAANPNRQTRLECDILTLFPLMVQPVLEQSMLKRAQEKGLLSAHVHNLRDFTQDKHQTADDYPYGGGGGMIMKPEPIFRAVDQIRKAGRSLRIPECRSRLSRRVVRLSHSPHRTRS